jgi:hypothetical protein
VAATLEQVGVVDAGGMDADAHFVRRGMWALHRDEAEHVRGTWSGETDC